MLIFVQLSRAMSSFQGKPVENLSLRVLCFFYGVNADFTVYLCPWLKWLKEIKIY